MTDRFDAGGTRPGLVPSAPVKNTINLKCRNPRGGCDSLEAIEIKLETSPHHGQRLYRCAKCGHAFSLNVGGHIDI